MILNRFGHRVVSPSFFVYLNFAILLPISIFREGPLRFALLALLMAYFLTRFGSKRAVMIVDKLIAKIGLVGQLILFEIIPIAVFFTSLASPHKVRTWEALVVIIVIAGLLWRNAHAVDDSAKRQHGPLAFEVLLFGLALSVPILNIASGLLVPKLTDIATTTIDAVRLVLQGQNPYSAALDYHGAINAQNPDFGGYKYLPLMIIFHLPFVVLFGSMSVLWVNALLIAGLYAVIWKLSQGGKSALSTQDMRVIAIATLLATPALSESSLAMGVNDIPGTLLVMAAFAVWRRSSLLAGLLVGCSLSFKLMPGLVATTLLFPPNRWKAYVTGMILGLLPTAAFLAWDPSAFIRNILLFNLVRIPDPTSWRLFAPLWLGRAASMGALALWIGASLWLALRSWGRNTAKEDLLDTRMGVFVIAVMMLIMTGLTAHDGYMIWWTPAMICLFAREHELCPAETQN